MSKDTEKYNYTYSDIGVKSCVNERAWPQSYLPLNSREIAKSASEGYTKIKTLSGQTEIDENTLRKNNMYSKSKGHADYWVETTYIRTRMLKGT